MIMIMISLIGYGQKETKELSEKNLSGFSNYVKIYYKETKNLEKGTIIKYTDIYFQDERYKAIKSMEDLVILDDTFFSNLRRSIRWIIFLSEVYIILSFS